jgi:hypothetical protein
MSLATSYVAGIDPLFVQKVQMALIAGAIQIILANANPDHVALAKLVLRNPRQWSEHFSLAAASDDATTAASTDNAIRARLLVVLPAFAGAF